MDHAVGSKGPQSPEIALRLNDRRFYTGVSIAAAAVVFAGFARTYYLRGFTDADALTPLVHVHGAVFSAWLVLLIVQARLIAGRRVAVHRKLGYAMAGLAGAMVVLGLVIAIAGARRGHTVPGITPEAFMLGPITNIFVFGILVTLAMIFRRRSAVHKRLMMLALTGGLLIPAIARIPWIADHPLLGLLVFILFVASGAVYDRWSRGKIHPVNKWVALAVFLSLPLNLAVSRTAVWERIATWLIR